MLRGFIFLIFILRRYNIVLNDIIPQKGRLLTYLGLKNGLLVD